MQLIRINSEPSLNTTLENIKNSTDGWSGISLDFSDYNVSNTSDPHHKCINMLVQYLSSFTGKIYSINKNSFVLLVKDISFKEVKALKNNIHTFYTDDQQMLRDHCFKHYLLKERFNEFYTYCMAKIHCTSHNNNIKASSNVEDDIISITLDALMVKERLNRKKLVILLADDDDFSRKLAKRALLDHVVIMAKDGKEVVEKYALYVPDICYLDIDMPVIDGVAALQHIRRMDDNAYVIMLTANSEKLTVQEVINNGALGYIVKPFTMEKLQTYIDRYKTQYSKNCGV